MTERPSSPILCVPALFALLLSVGCSHPGKPTPTDTSDASKTNQAGSTDLAQEGSVCSATVGFSATGTSQDVALSWAGASGVTYVVARKTYCGTDDYLSLATLPAGSTSYVDSNVNAEWVYWYKLTATDGSGNSVSVALGAQAAQNGMAGCSAGATIADSGVDPNACVPASATPDMSTGDAGGTGATSVSCTGTESTLTIAPAVPQGGTDPSTGLNLGTENVGGGSTSALIAIINRGNSAASPGAIGLSGDAAGDYEIEDDCPASLAMNEQCHARVTFKPTNTGPRNVTLAVGGRCATPINGTGVSPANAFFVSTSGDDSGDGSIDHPFRNLGKAQQAMQASGGTKLVTYLRAGKYAQTSTVTLGSADSGETWSAYPADGIDSAVLDGGGTSSSSPGLGTLFVIGGTKNITINGITFQNFSDYGVNGYGSTGVVIKNSVAANGYEVKGNNYYGAQGFACYGVCSNWSILDNVMHDITGGGANVVSGGNTEGGDIIGLIYSGNVVYNTCTSTIDGGDCGALYMQDNAYKSYNITVVGNFVHDGNPYLDGSNGSGIYLDDCTSGVTVSGNVVTGNNGSNTTFLHAGKNDLYIGNIIDVGPSAQHASGWQTSANPYCSKSGDPDFMVNNLYTGNIVISAKGTSYTDLTYPNTKTPTVNGNLYYSYGGDSINTSPDSNPVLQNPMLSGCYDVGASCPALLLGFSPLLESWGPPGYKLPSGGTEPSYPSPSCY